MLIPWLVNEEEAARYVKPVGVVAKIWDWLSEFIIQPMRESLHSSLFFYSVNLPCIVGDWFKFVVVAFFFSLLSICLASSETWDLRKYYYEFTACSILMAAHSCAWQNVRISVKLPYNRLATPLSVFVINQGEKVITLYSTGI